MEVGSSPDPRINNLFIRLNISIVQNCLYNFLIKGNGSDLNTVNTARPSFRYLLYKLWLTKDIILHYLTLYYVKRFPITRLLCQLVILKIIDTANTSKLINKCKVFRSFKIVFCLRIDVVKKTIPMNLDSMVFYNGPLIETFSSILMS